MIKSEFYNDLSFIPIFIQHIFVFRLHAYFGFNRNLLRVKDLDLKCKHLKRGRIQIVSFLSEMPVSKHDPQSFAVDLTLFTVMPFF